MKEKLQGSAQMEVLKASEERKKPAPVKSGLPRLSMRERMMQMKKQQAAKGEDECTRTASPPGRLCGSSNGRVRLNRMIRGRAWVPAGFTGVPLERGPRMWSRVSTTPWLQIMSRDG